MNLIPFSYPWILKKAIGSNIYSMLDVGCGEGELMSIVSRNTNWKITGADLYAGAVEIARKSGVYKSVVKGDITNLKNMVGNKKYDVVISSQVIEHLPKEKGSRALLDWEKFAKKRIVVATPIGFTPFEKIGEKEKEKNPYQKHISGWEIEDFKKLGYSVHGQGLKIVYGTGGLARKADSKLSLLFWEILSFMLSPFTYVLPEIAFIMICTKDVNRG